MAHGFVIFLKIFTLFAVLWSCKAFFDIDELNSINYGIELIPKPVLLGEAVSGAHHVVLSTKHGQQYQCTFQDKKVQAEKEHNEEQNAKETGIPELLKPMEDGPCLLANKGWWTYEFCYGKMISQYHLEDGKLLGKTLILGVYQSEYDWKKEEDEKAKKERLRRYHSQQYSNGTLCDVTSQPRRSEVRFVCDDSTGDYISTIDEPESCVYVITVHTPRICHHPYLKPTRTSKTVPITCHPVLSHDQYTLYMNEVAVKKQKQEMKKKKRTDMWEETMKLLNEKKAAKKGSPDDDVVKNFRDTMLNVIKIKAGAGETKRKLTSGRDDVIEQWNSEEAKDEAEALADFDRGLAEIAADPEKRKILPSLKDRLEETMTKEFGGIIKEAHNELRAEGEEPFVDETIALKNLADTLSTLLRKLDESTKEVEQTKQQLDESAQEARLAREKLLNKLVRGESTQKPKPVEQPTGGATPLGDKMPSGDITPSDEQRADLTDPVTDHETPSVRVTHRRPDDKQTVFKFDQNEDGNFGEEQRKQLESQVKAELKRAGLDFQGQKIQVKIISSLSKDGDDLTDSDKTSFKRMVVAILGRNADEEAAAEREDNLFSAYNYRWRPQQPPDDDKDEL